MRGRCALTTPRPCAALSSPVGASHLPSQRELGQASPGAQSRVGKVRSGWEQLGRVSGSGCKHSHSEVRRTTTCRRKNLIPQSRELRIVLADCGQVLGQLPGQMLARMDLQGPSISLKKALCLLFIEIFFKIVSGENVPCIRRLL